MDKKTPVKIEPMQKREYSFSNMHYCKHCDIYTTLAEEGCIQCHQGKLIPFDLVIDKICKRNYLKEIISLINIFLLIVVLGGILFPSGMMGGVVSLLVFIICLVTLIIIQKKYIKHFRALEIEKIVKTQKHIIKKSLQKDFEQANNNISRGEYLEAYNKLRNLATIIKHDDVKKARIHCLNRFAIRSDMPLEIDDLLLSDYYYELVTYIYELSKVQRSLIKQPAIQYMIRQEQYILRDFDNASLILASIAGAALYSKSSLELNKNFINRYMNHISKDRLLRLEKLIYSNAHYDWEELQETLGGLTRDYSDY